MLARRDRRQRIFRVRIRRRANIDGGDPAREQRRQRIVRAGRDVVVVVAEAAYDRATGRGKTAIELFSALRGAGLDLQRDRDTGRDTAL